MPTKVDDKKVWDLSNDLWDLKVEPGKITHTISQVLFIFLDDPIRCVTLSNVKAVFRAGCYEESDNE